MEQDNQTGPASRRQARLDEMLDRQDILDSLNRICRGMDRFDRALFLSGYHEDAVIDAGSLVGPPAEVYERGAELHEHGQTATLHNLLNHYCEIEGDTAHAETYYFYTGCNRDGSNWLAGGRYIDRLERRDGAWRIAFRYTLVEWSSSVEGNSVPLFDQVPDLRVNGEPSRSADDPSYRRPLVNRRSLSTPADMRTLSQPDK